MQAALDAGLVIETLYCTQQTGGLTRGITLRAIQTPSACASIRLLTGSTVRGRFARTTTLRASRYRTFSRGWAFRPNYRRFDSYYLLLAPIVRPAPARTAPAIVAFKQWPRAKLEAMSRNRRRGRAGL